MLVPYFIIKLFLAIGAGIVFIISGIHASDGFAKLLFEEVKSEAADSSKKGGRLPVLPPAQKKS